MNKDDVVVCRRALLVGVNHYLDKNIRELNYCVNDVLGLEKTLTQSGYEQVVVLRDDVGEERLFPTRNNIVAALNLISKGMTENDLLLVHFSCHGHLLKELDNKPILILRDTYQNNLVETALSVEKIKEKMGEGQARQLVLTLDACHSGVNLGRDGLAPDFIRNVYELAEGFAIIAASTASQVAQEWDVRRKGIFSHYLIEGLEGKADIGSKQFVTVHDIQTYVLNGLRKWNANYGGVIQEPNISWKGLGDIILADYRSLKQITANPFGDKGRITDTSRFFNRQELIRQIIEELNKDVNISLVGSKGIGKSSLLDYLCTEGETLMKEKGGKIRKFVYFNLQLVDDEDEFYEEFCEKLEVETCRGYKLNRVLKGKRYVLCLDEIEQMTWDGFTKKIRRELRGLADGGDVPFKLVIASRSPLSHLFPDSSEIDSPLAGICRQLELKPFSEEVVRDFIAHRLQGTGVSFNEREIEELWQESEGHPGKLQDAAYKLFRQKTKSNSYQ